MPQPTLCVALDAERPNLHSTQSVERDDEENLSLYHWLRTLPQNPIYQREKGGWGTPNLFFENMRRYSPFIVMGLGLIGFCAGSGNSSVLAGNNSLFAIYCLLCIPGIIINIMTLAGLFLAPALTAPSICTEVESGTWEVLLMTPQSTRSIVFAKMFGALSRLRWLWPVLFLLSVLQGMTLMCSMLVMGDQLFLMAIPTGAAMAARPWLEVMLAAMAGMLASMYMRSTMMALLASYTFIVILKLFNSSPVWYFILQALEAEELVSYMMSVVGPTAVYTISVISLAIGTLWRANKMGYDTV